MFAGVVADEIVASIQDATADHGKSSVVLAGGSTPGVIYRVLSHPPRVQEVDWPKVSLFLGDERWTATSDEQSNFRMVQETLLRDLPKDGEGPNVYPFDLAAASPEDCCKAYAATLRGALGAPAGQPPRLDLVLLGLGEDGHFASLFPGTNFNQPSAELCCVTTNPANDAPRLSLTFDFLKSAARILFIVRGESKAPILKRVLEGDEPPEVIPARIWETVNTRITWFLDSSVAVKLSKVRA
jgi:6-phosphogluconolactonase